MIFPYPNLVSNPLLGYSFSAGLVIAVRLERMFSIMVLASRSRCVNGLALALSQLV